MHDSKSSVLYHLQICWLAFEIMPFYEGSFFFVIPGYEKCILVAHDWGGAVAQVFISLYPKMVQRFIICNIPHPGAFESYLQSNPKQVLMSW